MLNTPHQPAMVGIWEKHQWQWLTEHWKDRGYSWFFHPFWKFPRNFGQLFNPKKQQHRDSTTSNKPWSRFAILVVDGSWALNKSDDFLHLWRGWCPRNLAAHHWLLGERESKMWKCSNQNPNLVGRQHTYANGWTYGYNQIVKKVYKMSICENVFLRMDIFGLWGTVCCSYMPDPAVPSVVWLGDPGMNLLSGSIYCRSRGSWESSPLSWDSYF